MLAAAVLVLTAGCEQRQQPDAYVARVGTATLREDELAALAGSRTEHLTQQYVNTWVTSELLYQEARRRGFAESADVLRQLEEAKKQLAINAFLEQEIFNDDTTGPDETVLLEEFTTNRETYRLREDIVKMSFAIFDEREAANTFRLKILRGTSWADALRAVSEDPEARDHLLRSSTMDHFSRSTLFPEELWKIGRTLSKEDVSYVVRTNAGYCVAIVHDARKQGDLPDFDFARDEARQRVLIRLRNARYTELLERLRSHNEVEVRLPPDTVSQEQQ